MTGLFALCSLRLRFDLPYDALNDPLKTPPFISVAKFIQLGACIGGFIFFAQMLGTDVRLLNFAASLYVWVGLLNAIYANVSWIMLMHYGIDLHGAYEDFSGFRACALFNEGAPYGLYAASILLVAAFKYYGLGTMYRLQFWALVAAPVGLSIVLSGSKSGALCLIALFAWTALTQLRIVT
jgi:hypothetical protein